MSKYQHIVVLAKAKYQNERKPSAYGKTAKAVCQRQANVQPKIDGNV